MDAFAISISGNIFHTVMEEKIHQWKSLFRPMARTPLLSRANLLAACRKESG
jgi:hypothetical protein